jgi:hypothetical protein
MLGGIHPLLRNSKKTMRGIGMQHRTRDRSSGRNGNSSVHTAEAITKRSFRQDDPLVSTTYRTASRRAAVSASLPSAYHCLRVASPPSQNPRLWLSTRLCNSLLHEIVDRGTVRSGWPLFQIPEAKTTHFQRRLLRSLDSRSVALVPQPFFC